MDINSWDDTWGRIKWGLESEERILQKIRDFYKAGVDFNMIGGECCDEGTPLMFAAQYSTPKVIDLLISGGANVESSEYLADEYGKTPLHVAALWGKTENVKVLLEHCSRKFLNKQSNQGWTALHYAAREGLVETVKVLLEAGADMNIKNEYGWTPLHCTSFRQFGWTALGLSASYRAEVAEVLINAGADVDAKDDDGKTPLLCVAGEGFLGTADKLIKAGADINTKDNGGNTALYYAVRAKNANMVKALIEYGIDVNAKNNKGDTALDQTDNSEIKELIENADQIRADYLKKNPQTSLRQTLKSASRSNKGTPHPIGGRDSR